MDGNRSERLAWEMSRKLSLFPFRFVNQRQKFNFFQQCDSHYPTLSGQVESCGHFLLEYDAIPCHKYKLYIRALTKIS